MVCETPIGFKVGRPLKTTAEKRVENSKNSHVTDGIKVRAFFWKLSTYLHYN